MCHKFSFSGLVRRLIDIDIDLIRLGGLIGPICRSITSVLDSCLVKKHAGTLLPQMLYYVRAFHLLNRCSAIYVLVPVRLVWI